MSPKNEDEPKRGRGRPAMADESRKVVVAVPLTADEKAAWEAAAESIYISVPEMVRRLVAAGLPTVAEAAKSFKKMSEDVKLVLSGSLTSGEGKK